MKRGLFAGSFDPITAGHADMIERAARLVDELTVLVIRNYSKKSMFTEPQRVRMIEDVCAGLPNVKVAFAEGHLATYMLEEGYDVMFRGLRNASDFEYELILSQIYAKFLGEKGEVVYLMTDPRYSYISSSIVKENFMLGADVSGWVRPSTLELMKEFYNENKQGESK